jgi:hypothetical protein
MYEISCIFDVWQNEYTKHIRGGIIFLKIRHVDSTEVQNKV